MLGEYFVDICLTAGVSLKPIDKHYKEFFENVLFVFDWYQKEIPEDNRPIEFRDKVGLVHWLALQHTTSKYDPDTIFATMEGGKYASFVNNLRERRTEIDEDKFDKWFQTILNRKKLCEVVKGKMAIQQLLNDIDSCNFEDDSAIVERWSNQITEAHDNLMRVQRIEAVSTAASLDITKDSYQGLLEKMMETIDIRKTLKTGFDSLKRRLVGEGFENRRLYVIGGSSGIGKSVMLINLIKNAMLDPGNVVDNLGESPTYLYITAENLIDETWIRFFCCLTGKPHFEFMETLRRQCANVAISRDIDENKEAFKEVLVEFEKQAKERIAQKLSGSNANVIFKYVPADITTVRDINSITDGVAHEKNLRGVFIDYLDLLTTGRNLELRFELKAITQGLKNLAVDYDVPVITATQLNREGYRPEAAPSLTQMGESMEKVNKADAVLFLQETKTKEGFLTVNGRKEFFKRIKMTLLKQRNGPTGDSCHVGMTTRLEDGSNIFNFQMKDVPEIENDDVKAAKATTSFAGDFMSDNKGIDDFMFNS